MILIYIECVPTVYSEDVYQLLRHKRYLSVATHRHMVATIEHSTLMQKYGKVGSIGLPCMRMPSLLFDDVSDVKSMGT
jgi:predicted DNA-binding WGR domain protein